MDKKTQYKYMVAGGAVIIAGVIFLSARYLLTKSPFVKILAIALIVSVSYLVIDYLRKKNKEI
jgi:hypothetical protein|tara:strand:- start:1848 stop:2036 length:189 start_codon:yes stop_codon:yes gene_type:complete